MRPTSADVVYHVLNRANALRTLFEDDGDYASVNGCSESCLDSQICPVAGVADGESCCLARLGE